MCIAKGWYIQLLMHYMRVQNVVERTYKKKRMLLKGIEGITAFDKGEIYLHY